jgi:hypothetical protein
MSGDSGVLVVTRVRSTTTKSTRDRGCNGHPAFPTPSMGGEKFINGSGAMRREREVVCGLDVIPGWSEGPDPESRDSGFDASHRPGMTAMGLRAV